ncbi:MAG: 4-(cytidine 5'-diphospho)-2-C-methyl-D-erythritol kinase [Firmicutes bacterium]|jgi:4-diphosphocytidyl-2-C-methyl-D-erythritol kinase|nr:4-(cytidine 5'-diphospho)-2-C-methyl-D-erythritol kinase [Bacillota bacterium]MDH7495416.1 4-(cytidine 5'-diphospho)-2-C-methyl-D-erythritol kinase [Bacillota bacterium]
MSRVEDKRLLIIARAKLNLTLDILGRRPDGYHELESVVQSIDLYDGVALGSTPAHRVSGQGRELGVTLACQNPLVPLGQENLAFKAALALSRHVGVGAAVWIDIKKRIPVSAGLGGGSADAAAVLLGLNELWGLGLDDAELAAIGETVGADVPFCLTGGTGVIRGKGEKIERLPALENVWFVVVVPEGGISTAEAYAAYDRLSADESDSATQVGGGGGPRAGCATPAMIRAVAEHDLRRVVSGISNDLERAAATMVPSVRDAKKALLEAGALGVGMSGSGPAVFGIAEDERTAREIRRIVREAYDTTFVCCSSPTGLESISVRHWKRRD